MPTQTILLIMGALLVGGAAGYYLRLLLLLQRKNSIDIEIKKMRLSAREKAQDIITDAERKTQKNLEKAEKNRAEREKTTTEKEERLIKKETFLDKRQEDIDTQRSDLKGEREELQSQKEDYQGKIREVNQSLQRVSRMSQEEARELLFKNIEKEYADDLFARIQKLDRAGHEKLTNRARSVLVSTIHRLGTSVVSEAMTTTVSLKNENEKGKIIGKEGRNIQSFEKLAGVDLIIDDTPGVVTISAFDPLRRHIAKRALESLIDDGRIQPAKIEASIKEAGDRVNTIILQKGSEAAHECGLTNLSDSLLRILGRLHFRTSYGQNVLAHSVEVAHIAGMLAEELGADAETARAGGLFHDIGKAVDHEVRGTHVEIGRKILRRYSMPEEVIQAMQSHHEEYPFETPESVIVQVADAISGSRPGARKQSTEHYLKRLSELENLANSFIGVDRSYVISAGREIRVFVTPDNISDLEAQKLAHDIATSVEEELQYPGEIKISVMRETRYIEFAR